MPLFILTVDAGKNTIPRTSWKFWAIAHIVCGPVSYTHLTCTVCGYVETVEIEKLPAAEPNPDTGTSTDNTDTNAQSPQTGDNSNIVLWFSLMLVAGAALAGTAVYARKKKRSR